jgi:hypothetical protein
MIELDSLTKLRTEMRRRVVDDAVLLDQLCTDVRPLRAATRRIQPRTTTAISLVGTDGGNNKIHFDPFFIQIVRVVDSSQNEYCLEVVSPTSDVTAVSQRHRAADGTALTALGRMMQYLGVHTLSELSPMIPATSPKPSWVQVYRELMEWAVLFEVVRERHFATDTVIVRDGFLRSKVFTDKLFKRYRQGIEDAIAMQFSKHRRRIFLTGIAKHSKVLQRYRLAMALEGVLRTGYAAYVEVPRDLERNVYQWSEYARGNESEVAGGESNKFVAGKMFFVKFGDRPHDPLWAIDLLESQREEASAVFGYLLADALNGFPVPLYPQCLQTAHENAELVDFDFWLMEDEITAAIRGHLRDKAHIVDEFELHDPDPSAARYD